MLAQHVLEWARIHSFPFSDNLMECSYWAKKYYWCQKTGTKMREKPFERGRLGCPIFLPKCHCFSVLQSVNQLLLPSATENEKKRSEWFFSAHHFFCWSDTARCWYNSSSTDCECCVWSLCLACHWLVSEIYTPTAGQQPFCHYRSAKFPCYLNIPFIFREAAPRCLCVWWWVMRSGQAVVLRVS